MRSEEIINTLAANTGKRIRVTFSDDVVQTVVIGSLDDEGFLHSGLDCAESDAFWTGLEQVKMLEVQGR